MLIFEIVFNETTDLNLSALTSQARESKRAPSKIQFINLQNSEGLASIHFAAYRGNNDIIKELVDRGANPYLKDKYGHNIIHIST